MEVLGRCWCSVWEVVEAVEAVAGVEVEEERCLHSVAAVGMDQ